MTVALSRRLQALLIEAGLPPTQIVSVVNAFTDAQSPSGKARSGRSANHKQMAALSECINAARGSVRGARKDRHPYYKAYLDLLLKTQAYIKETLQTTTWENARNVAKETNEKRREHGMRPLGSCETHWATWIPPHVRQATVQTFDTLYAAETGAAAKGRRLIPFSTLKQRHVWAAQWARLALAAKMYVEDRARYPAVEFEMLPAATRHVILERARAAHVAMKEMELRKADVSSPRAMPPMYWLHVLDDKARERLRQAELEAGGDGRTPTLSARTVWGEDGVLTGSSSTTNTMWDVPLPTHTSDSADGSDEPVSTPSATPDTEGEEEDPYAELENDGTHNPSVLARYNAARAQARALRAARAQGEAWAQADVPPDTSFRQRPSPMDPTPDVRWTNPPKVVPANGFTLLGHYPPGTVMDEAFYDAYDKQYRLGKYKKAQADTSFRQVPNEENQE